MSHTPIDTSKHRSDNCRRWIEVQASYRMTVAEKLLRFLNRSVSQPRTSFTSAILARLLCDESRSHLGRRFWTDDITPGNVIIDIETILFPSLAEDGCFLHFSFIATDVLCVNKRVRSS